MVRADQATDQYRIASFHYARGDWQQAIDAFDQFLAQHPDHSQVGVIHFYRGESLVQLSRSEEALRAYTLFLSKLPQHSFAEHAEFRVAECYFLSGQYEAAKNAFQIFQGKYKNSKLIPHAYPYLAEIASKEQRWDEAILMYGKSVKEATTPNMTIESRLGLARCYGQTGDWKEAGLTYEQLLIDLKDHPGKYAAGTIALEAGIAEFKAGNYRRAVDRFELAAKQQPKLDEQTSFWIAKTYYQVRDWPNAAERLEQLKANQSLPEFQDEIHYLMAKISLAQGSADDAIALFNEQIESWPESSWTDEALYQLITIHLDGNDMDAAQAAWQQLSKRPQPNSLTIRAQMSLAAHLQTHDAHAKALEVLQSEFPQVEAKVAQADRRNYLTAVSLFALSRKEEAKQLLESSESMPAGPYRGMSLMLLGLIHSQDEEWTNTVDVLDRSLQDLTATEHRNLVQLRRTTALLHCDRVKDAKEAWSQVDRRQIATTTYLNEVSQIAGAAYRSGEIAWAKTLYQELAAQDNPEKFVEQGLAGLAWCQLATSDAAAATKTLDQLLEKNPNSALAVGAMYQQAQQMEEVDVELAIGRYQQLAAHHPQDPLAAHAKLRCASLLDQLQRDAEAEAILVELTESKPDVLPAEDLWYRLAWVRIDQKKQDEAIEAFEQIHQRFQDSDLWEDSTYRIAEAALSAGDIEKAREYLKKLLEKKGQSKVAMFGRYMLGQVEVHAGNWQAAIPHMDAVAEHVADEPLHSMAMFWGGEARFRSEKFAEAKTKFEQMLTDNMGRDLESLPIAEMRLAQIFAHQDDWEAAYQKALEIENHYPNFAQAHELDYLMGRCLARQGEFQKARAAYRKVTQSPTAAQGETAAMAQWMIGETYFHQKNYDAAVRAYAQVATNHEAFSKWKAAALLQIGKCREIQENWEKATQYYTEVSTDFGDSPFAPEAETRLSVVRQRTQQAQREGTRTK
ncbi:tol-pal system protein YbgF [Bremerella volcania]|uniref:Tol-pal system protein YbgF n=1 Tax=Bremerella volcania TaxID=2527984 RepID=A0A518C7N7_9BACT|nr:tetratricopeptide repeat protein [Bremerella volcania]QDU75246.1 tol-pal system protein YbgF [Bremerella volcania]